MSMSIAQGLHVNAQQSEIKLKGKSILVPMRLIDDREVVSVGRWLRIAAIKDEEWLETEPVAKPEQFVAALRQSGLPADIFAFSAPIKGSAVGAGFPFEMDNVAAIRTRDYAAWWEGLPQEARKNTRRAAKRGVEVRVATFDDELVAGIKTMYDETPIRQGRKFWHYGKSLEAVRRDNSSYLDRCEFLGAYYNGQLIGFMKYVFTGDTARIMQILCLNAHQDKRTIIALIVKAVERCHQRGLEYLIYGKFTYGQKTDSSIAEFKRRLGFEQLEFRRYFVPLTSRGRIALHLGLHRGWQALLPAEVLRRLLELRSWWLQRHAPSGTSREIETGVSGPAREHYPQS